MLREIDGDVNKLLIMKDKMRFSYGRRAFFRRPKRVRSVRQAGYWRWLDQAASPPPCEPACVWWLQGIPALCRLLGGGKFVSVKVNLPRVTKTDD
jgi:hypothetical protein